MSPANSSLSVFTEGGLVCVKIQGCATVACSQQFRTLMTTLRERGASSFVLDLTNCLLMDSTFLGVLASVVNLIRAERPPGTFSLLNPSERIVDLLKNLGVDEFFHVLKQDVVATDRMVPIEIAPMTADKHETTKICIEAHRVLAQLNPKNAPKFKDVIRFLEEDLKKSAP